jgi:hypothetical protein
MLVDERQKVARAEFPRSLPTVFWSVLPVL